MIVPGSASPLLASAGGYNLTNSLRFRQSASARLTRTPASASNRKTYTISAWVKLGSLDSSGIGTIFCGGDSSTNASTHVYFYLNQIRFYWGGAGGPEWRTTQVFRDYSAWYHLVFAVDTNQATLDDKLKLYVNGVRFNSWVSQNSIGAIDTQINNNVAHGIGSNAATAQYLFDGYMTEFNFIDGQQLTPSSFGETSATTGVWIPKKFVGTYGTNGFYLPFTDNSALTTSSNAGLGKDFSGNANYFATNGISITSGSTYDSMTDVPTLTSATAGNYATVNPLNAFGTTTSGNLNYYTTSNYQGGYATMAVAGKIYFEVSCANPTGGGALVGFVKNATIPIGVTNFFAQTGFYGAIFSNTLNYYLNGSSDGLDHGNITNSMLQFAVDRDTGKCWVGSNNTWFESGDPATGANPAWTISLSSGDLLFPAFCAGNSTYTISVNFGQRPFAYTPPTGFKALNTFNLPTPTIGATASTLASKNFTAVLRNGYGSSGGTLACGFQPDFVWEKTRNPASSHTLWDSNRGLPKALRSDSDTGDVNQTWLTGFVSNGLTFGTNDYGTGVTLVEWVWKANQGNNIINTQGSITSTVSANPAAGFSIVTYTGNNTNGATVGHGLGVTPSMIIIKVRNATARWVVYQKDATTANNQFLQLNSTIGVDTSGTNFWTIASINDTTFGLGTNGDTNGSTLNFVAYCFAEVAGYSKIGKYTGTGAGDDTNGPFIYCGFRPAFIIIKADAGGYNWAMMDSKRPGYNSISYRIMADVANEETTVGDPQIDFVSNGFKLRAGISNYAGTVYYMAFAESPFKYANAR